MQNIRVDAHLCPHISAITRRTSYPKSFSNLILDHMPSRQHSLMKNPADEDAVRIHAVKHDMFLILETSVPHSNAITRASQLWRNCQSTEAFLETAVIPSGLFQTPRINGVIGDFA